MIDVGVGALYATRVASSNGTATRRQAGAPLHLYLCIRLPEGRLDIVAKA